MPPQRDGLLIGVAMLTVVLSWTVLNMVSPCGTPINTAAWAAQASTSATRTQRNSTYRDFAHVAFTIGMCYQVSDTTLRNRRIRRTAFSTPAVVHVRCGDRRWLGQSHNRPDSLDLCGAQGCVYSSTEAASSRM